MSFSAEKIILLSQVNAAEATIIFIRIPAWKLFGTNGVNEVEVERNSDTLVMYEKWPQYTWSASYVSYLNMIV